MMESFGELMDEYQDCIIQQYTSLKDKNGKEIYEGDIVKFKYMTGSPFNSDDEIIYKIGEIVWKGESFKIGWVIIIVIWKEL